MKYCARCGSEYQDSVNACADCPGNPLLVSAEEMRSRGLPLPHELDTRIFVRAGSAEDPSPPRSTRSSSRTRTSPSWCALAARASWTS